MLDRMRACAAVCCVLTLLYFVLLICFLNPYYMALFLLFFSLLASIFLSNLCTVFTCASYAFARGGLGRLAARIQHRLNFFDDELPCTRLVGGFGLESAGKWNPSIKWRSRPSLAFAHSKSPNYEPLGTVSAFCSLASFFFFKRHHFGSFHAGGASRGCVPWKLVAVGPARRECHRGYGRLACSIAATCSIKGGRILLII